MDNLKTGLLIRELRKEKGMTQKDLAELLHITDRAVSKWERGLCAPDLSTLEPLAQALGITISELIAGERMTAPIEGLEKTVKEVVDYSRNEIVRKTRALKIKLAIGCATVCALLFIIVLFINFKPTSIEYGTSELYSQQDMDVAIKIITNEFDSWDGCKLYSISYTNDVLCKRELEYCNSLTDGENEYVECIIFRTRFRSPIFGGGSWNRNFVYDWTWYLARTVSGEWQLLTWGAP